VGADLAERVVDAVLDDEGLTEIQLAMQVARGWLKRQGAAAVSALTSAERSPEALRARRRLHGYLARRGFGGAALARAMEVALAAPSAGPHPLDH